MNTFKTSTTEFITHCQFEKNLSKKTLKAYNIDLKQLKLFLDTKSINDIQLVDKTILREYFQLISNLKPKTVNRKIATIKALFNFLEFEDTVIINPFRKMKVRVREPRILPTVMNILEIEKILKAVYKAKDEEKRKHSHSYIEKVRDISIIELLFATGIRVSELSDLKKNNIDLNAGLAKVSGKGNKERIIQICNPESLNSLREYSTIGFSNGHFFTNRLRKKLSDQSIRVIVKKYAKIAGIERRITPHVFRHSFATLLLEEDVDIKYIQHMLGHSSILVTQIYTHVNAEKQKDILTKSHPRKSFQIEKFSHP